MKMVNLVDINGTTQWFNANQVQKIDICYNPNSDKYETWIIFGADLSTLKVYGTIPSVIREIEEQIEFPKRGDQHGLSGPRYGSIEFKQYEV